MNPDSVKCANCFFGKRAAGRRSCHVNRPLKDGWPLVHDDDFCSYWTDPQTFTRPFLVLPQEPWPITAGASVKREIEEVART